MCRRHREQALLPRFGSVPACDFPANKKSPVGAKLARDSSVSVCLDVGCPPSSQASFAPTVWIGASLRFPCQQKSPVGAKLARDSSVSVCLDVGCPPSSRASFAPTVWIGASLRFHCQQKSPVRAKLARDSSVSVCLDVGCAAVIASKLCSHSLDRCQPAISLPTKIPCGSKACSR